MREPIFGTNRGNKAFGACAKGLVCLSLILSAAPAMGRQLTMQDYLGFAPKEVAEALGIPYQSRVVSSTLPSNVYAIVNPINGMMQVVSDHGMIYGHLNSASLPLGGLVNTQSTKPTLIVGSSRNVADPQYLSGLFNGGSSVLDLDYGTIQMNQNNSLYIPYSGGLTKLGSGIVYGAVTNGVISSTTNNYTGSTIVSGLFSNNGGGTINIGNSSGSGSSSSGAVISYGTLTQGSGTITVSSGVLNHGSSGTTNLAAGNNQAIIYTTVSSGTINPSPNTFYIDPNLFAPTTTTPISNVSITPTITATFVGGDDQQLLGASPLTPQFGAITGSLLDGFSGSSVPAPSSAAMLGVGAIALLRRRR